MTGRFLLAFCLLLTHTESSPANVCPGKHLRCPESMTCCQTSSEGVACCPFSDGTCCSDRLHCCPHGMQCNVAIGSCTKNGSPSIHYDWMVPLHSEMLDLVTTAGISTKESNDLEDSQVKKNECPDETVCHPAHTCCKMMSGKHGCCPFEEGVCCMDGQNCCPTGFRCTSDGECYSKKTNFTVRGYPMKDKKVEGFAEMELEKEKKAMEEDAIKTPGPVLENRFEEFPEDFSPSEKPDVVQLPPEFPEKADAVPPEFSEDVSPLEKAVADPLPTELLEDVSPPKEGVVVPPPQGDVSLPLPVNNATKLGDVCPDVRYVCPAHWTCCPLPHGGYSCCPYQYATCCFGGERCCPHGFHCMPGYCVRESMVNPFIFRRKFAKQESLQDEVLLKLEDQEESEMIEDSDSFFPRVLVP